MEQRSKCAYCGRTFSSERALEAHEKKFNHSITKPNPNPDLNLDRLKAVSPRMIEMIGLMNAREYDYHVPKELWPLWEAIAADMLRLADDVEKAYHEGYDQGVTGQPRRKRITPVSAEKADR